MAAALLIDAKPATFRSLQGWLTTLPLGEDLLRVRRTFDTAALSAAFPFTSPDLDATLGTHAVLYGTNTGSSSLVMWDRFAQDNHNSVILARSGAGKSYLAKLDILRSLFTGVEVCVIDPENEYARLADAVGGVHIALGADGVRLNPFDLPPGAHRTRDALTRRALFIHTLVAVLLEEPLDPGAKAALDRGIVAAYHVKGLTVDPRTWSQKPPLLADLAHALEADGDPKANEVAARLAPYVSGTWRGLFDGPTTTRPDSHLIVFSLRDLPDELKTVGTLLTLDAIWRRVSDPHSRRPRLVVVDEGWLLMRQVEGAKFLFRMAKSARKHWASLTVITQDAADVLGSELGQAVVANAATQILLRQAPPRPWTRSPRRSRSPTANGNCSPRPAAARASLRPAPTGSLSTSSPHRPSTPWPPQARSSSPNWRTAIPPTFRRPDSPASTTTRMRRSCERVPAHDPAAGGPAPASLPAAGAIERAAAAPAPYTG